MSLAPEVSAAVFPPPKRIGIIGLSDNPSRPSHDVAETLKRGGYNIYPVRPNAEHVLGERAYESVSSIPDELDIVIVFRRSEHVPEHIDDILAKLPKVLWLPDGVINESVASRARAAGMLVVQDDCMARRFHQWRLQNP
jgi:predicted CoA-binding protein